MNPSYLSAIPTFAPLAVNLDTSSKVVTPSARPCISNVLFKSAYRSFDSIAAIPSNVQALEAAKLFSSRVHNLICLVGPTGWGKNHLLEAIADRIGETDVTVPIIYNASEWALGVSRGDSDGPLLLDNVQDVLDKARTRQALRLALEWRVRSGRPTVLTFTAPKVNRSIKNLLPNSRDWVTATIASPEPMERIVILEQMARAENLHLNPSLCKLISFRMRGNGRTLIGALKRLKLSGNQWEGTHSTIKACGLLEPFFSDNCDWDLREGIFRASQAMGRSLGERGVSDLSIYLMLKSACLSESQVAQFFNIEPSEAYLRCSQFDRKAEVPFITHLIDQTIDKTVKDLLQE